MEGKPRKSSPGELAYEKGYRTPLGAQPLDPAGQRWQFVDLPESFEPWAMRHSLSRSRGSASQAPADDVVEGARRIQPRVSGHGLSSPSLVPLCESCF
jgi:hypothetical protein